MHNAYLNKGLILRKLKQYKQMILCFDEAIKSNRRFEEAYYNKGLA